MSKVDPICPTEEWTEEGFYVGDEYHDNDLCGGYQYIKANAEYANGEGDREYCSHCQLLNSKGL